MIKLHRHARFQRKRPWLSVVTGLYDDDERGEAQLLTFTHTYKNPETYGGRMELLKRAARQLGREPADFALKSVTILREGKN